jgi:hypothetical protein
MNFVYISRGDENQELRYSIRSVEKYFPNSEVWIVGGVPNWYKGKNIYVEQSSTKYKNAAENLKTIVQSDEIPEQFILMNDDFFILDTINTIPYYHEGLLSIKIEKYKKLKMDVNYIGKLGSTYAKLEKIGFKQPLSYETHTPMPMEKNKLKTILKDCPANFWRSLYGNIHQVGGEEIKDVKVYYRNKFAEISNNYQEQKVPFLSTDDESFIKIRDDLFLNKFKEKSKYEK